MFGDLMGMMGKIKETQRKIEETKERLNNVFVDEVSPQGKVKVSISVSRVIKSIEISEELLQDKEALEDYLILTLNKALAKANEINERELAAVAKEGMPNIPGLNF